MFEVTRDVIDPRNVEAAARTTECGGVVTFLGVVRERANDGRAVSGLEYEAHESMVLDEFRRIAEEVREQHPEVRLAIVHRIGQLALGDVAVCVCAASPHRAEAFDACEYAIDQLKARAPIWKKERYVDGSAEWVANAC